MPRQKGIHKEDIKAAIRKKGETLKGLSLSLGFSPTSVHKSLDKPCPRVNRKVADFLGASVNSLWPRWYDESGQRIYRKSKIKTIRKKPRRQCKKSKGGFA